MNSYDLIIIGGGPGGMSSALYAGRAKLKTLLIEKSTYGGRIKDTSEIINFPSIKKASGQQLSTLLKEQLNNFDSIEFLKTTVTNIEKKDDTFIISTKRKGNFYSKTVIIATGTSPKILNIEGEQEFTGNGVAYCATCDAEFFKDQEVFVLGAGDQAIEESMFISKFAKKVTIIVIHEEGKLDCNELAKNQVFKNKKIDFIWNSTVNKINGTNTVESIDILNIKTNKITNHKTNGLFSFVGTIPNTNLIKNLVNTTNSGYIIVNEKKETSLQGIYAVGDCTNNYLKQVITACSDGAIAATAAERFITEQSIINKELSQNNIILFAFYNPYNNICIKNLSTLEKNISNINITKIDISKQDYLYKKLNLNNDFNIVLYKNQNIIFKLEKNILEEYDLYELKKLL